MKLTKLSALCAFACVALSGQAMAATAITGATTTPATGDALIVNDANTNNRVIYISGASAVQKGFTSIVASLLSGTPIWFSNASGTPNDFQAVAGKLATATTNWPVGTNVILMYRVKGGSAFGVDPVARNTAIEALDVNTTAAACLAGTGAAATPYTCTTTLASRTPDAGVSDVAPALFHAAYNTEGEPAHVAPALSPAELALLTPTPIYGIAFGVPVTANVLTTVANGATLPALNKAAVAAIMTGNVGTWDLVDSKMAADDILICRRTPGSGTQAVFNMYFGNYPCNTVDAFNVPAGRDSSFADGDAPGTIWNATARTFTVPTANTGGLIVIENSSSGNVRDCLNAAANATAAVPVSYTTSDRDGVAVTVTFNGPKKAIGVLSMDSLSSSTTTSKWQFRSLDGAGTITQASSSVAPVTSGTGKFPTVASYTDGTWDMQGWVSFNVPARTTGDKLGVLNTFLAKAQDPAVLNSIAALKYVTAAMPGTPDTTPTPTGLVLRASYLGGNQCAPLNRNL